MTSAQKKKLTWGELRGMVWKVLVVRASRSIPGRGSIWNMQQWQPRSRVRRSREGGIRSASCERPASLSWSPRCRQAGHWWSVPGLVTLYSILLIMYHSLNMYCKIIWVFLPKSKQKQLVSGQTWSVQEDLSSRASPVLQYTHSFIRLWSNSYLRTGVVYSTIHEIWQACTCNAGVDT